MGNARGNAWLQRDAGVRLRPCRVHAKPQSRKGCRGVTQRGMRPQTVAQIFGAARSHVLPPLLAAFAALQLGVNLSFPQACQPKSQTPPPAAGEPGAGVVCGPQMRKGGWCHCARACSGPDCLSSLTGSGDTRHEPQRRGLYIVELPLVPARKDRDCVGGLPRTGSHRMSGATCRRVQGEALITTPQRPDDWDRNPATDDDRIDAFRAPVRSPTCPDWLPRKDCSFFVEETVPCRTTLCRTSRCCKGVSPAAPCHPSRASNG